MEGEKEEGGCPPTDARTQHDSEDARGSGTPGQEDT